MAEKVPEGKQLVGYDLQGTSLMFAPMTGSITMNDVSMFMYSRGYISLVDAGIQQPG